MNISEDNLLRMKNLLSLLQQVLKPLYQYQEMKKESLTLFYGHKHALKSG